MFKLFSVLLRAWQLFLFELEKLCCLLFIETLVVVVISLVIRDLLFHYIIGIYSYPPTTGFVLCLDALNFFKRISQFKVFRTIFQIKYPCKPTITDELVICNIQREREKKVLSRFEK